MLPLRFDAAYTRFDLEFLRTLAPPLQIDRRRLLRKQRLSREEKRY